MFLNLKFFKGQNSLINDNLKLILKIFTFSCNVERSTQNTFTVSKITDGDTFVKQKILKNSKLD